MQRLTLHLPLNSVKSPSPMTRASLVALAHSRSISGEAMLGFAVTELHEDDGQVIVLAEVELRRGAAGDWCLTYVTHPSRCAGLTGHIQLTPYDLEGFAKARSASDAGLVRAISADGLEADGLGPLAMLDLRWNNRFPVLPSEADCLRLLSMVGTQL